MGEGSDSTGVAVVGAGAAGITAAIRAAEAGAAVTLLNAHPRAGLKILMSGGTRCNVTHEVVRAEDYNGSSRHAVARVLKAFDAARATAWIESLGVVLKREPTGKLFPVTDDAATVLDALLRRARAAGVRLMTGARAIRLERGARFRVGIQRVANAGAFGNGVAEPGASDWPLPGAAPDAWLEAERVVVATGGLSFPKTGSDGTGYAILTALGHTLVPPVPALTPLVANDPLCARVQGVALPVVLRLGEGRRAARVSGDMLFAHFGYTGPAALDLSRHWWDSPGVPRRVTANLAGGAEPSELLARWKAGGSRETVRRFLSGRLPDALARALCDEAGVTPASPLSQVNREARGRLIRLVTARELPVTGTLGFEKAEVTAGGVPLAEVRLATLESRVVPGLHLCGEVLDVEGRLGGFNFQWAWSSGTVAGRAAGQAVRRSD